MGPLILSSLTHEHLSSFWLYRTAQRCETEAAHVVLLLLLLPEGDGAAGRPTDRVAASVIFNLIASLEFCSRFLLQKFEGERQFIYLIMDPLLLLLNGTHLWLNAMPSFGILSTFYGPIWLLCFTLIVFLPALAIPTLRLRSRRGRSNLPWRLWAT